MNTIKFDMTMEEINELDAEIYELFGTRENIIAYFNITVWDNMHELIDAQFARQIREMRESWAQQADEIFTPDYSDPDVCERVWYEAHGYLRDDLGWYYAGDTEITAESAYEYGDSAAIDAACTGKVTTTVKEIAMLEESFIEGYYNDIFDAWLQKACDDYLKYNS